MQKIKIVLIDNGKDGIITYYTRAFRKLGCQVAALDTGDYYKISFFNRILNWARKLPVYWGIGRLNSIITQKVVEIKPEIALFIKPIFILPKTIMGIKKEGIVVFSYYPDNILNRASISHCFLKSIPLYDCHFFANSANNKDYLKRGAKKAVFLPFAADPHIFYPAQVCPDEKQRLGADIVFVGTYEKERAQALEKLCSLGYDIKVYGCNWQKASHCGCLIKKHSIMRRPVFGQEMSEVFNSSRIILAFLRKLNQDSQTMRTYEIPACAGFMLHERTPEALALFEEGKEAEFFGSFQELKDKIDFYLKNEALRRQIAQAGYRKITAAGYTYEARARTILEAYFGDFRG